MKTENLLYSRLKMQENSPLDNDNQASVFWKKHGKRALECLYENCGQIEIRCELPQLGPFSSRTQARTLFNYFEELFFNAQMKRFARDISAAAEFLLRQSDLRNTFQFMNQTIFVSKLVKSGCLREDATVAVIGDGYGFTAALIKSLFPNVTVIEINLAPILIFDAVGLRMLKPDVERRIYCRDRFRQDGGVYFASADQTEALKDVTIDVFLNSCSMQEMDKATIVQYFSLMRYNPGDTFFYCLNREEKRLARGDTIRFDEYPWSKNDVVFFDEVCPWMKYRPVRAVGWLRKAPPLRHKLVQLAKNA